ncbi:MAG: SLC13 family permease [Anaerolineae bacterium]
MTPDILLVLGILGVAIILFVSEKLPVDLISMLVLITLILTGLVDQTEAFSGFASPAVITVWAIYIVSGGLFRTGVADSIGQRILALAGNSEPRLTGVLMLTVGIMSAFMNNIGATAILLPAVVSIARKIQLAASKLLIPLAFGSLLGGINTLIGTPPNILVSQALTEAGYAPFRIFDFTPMGLIIMTCSIVYMVLVGRHLLPTRQSESPTENFHLRDYLTEVRVLPSSPLVGKTVIESRFGQDYDLTILGRVPHEATSSPSNDHPDPSSQHRPIQLRRSDRIEQGDVLLVKGRLDTILKIKGAQGLDIVPEEEIEDAKLRPEETKVAEVVIPLQSKWIGQSLKQIDFRSKYNVTVLALWRDGTPFQSKLADEPLHLGDMLLVGGRKERINLLRNNPNFLLLEPVNLEMRRTQKAPLAIAIFALALVAVMMGWLHISAAAVLAGMTMILTGCLTMEEAYQSIQWKSVFLIAGMLPMGIAMEKTGTAIFLADQIIALMGGFGPLGSLLGLYFLTIVMTAVMSNAAAAVLIAPIGIGVAQELGIDPHAFLMGIAIAASNSFVFPIGHQANILVMGPGGYRFFDYTRVGLPLTVLIWVLATVFLPMFWPLF